MNTIRIGSWGLRSGVQQPGINAGLASAALLLSAGSPALGQPASEDAAGSTALEQVVVTARRKEESLQSIPVAVTAIGERELQMKVLRSEDLPLVAPGLTVMTSSRGATQPNYTIRGQRGDFNPTPLSDPAVGLYFADMNLARRQGTNQTLYDLASVQVLRGSQGTLFGRNSTGGAVLFTPNAPSHEFDMYVKAAAGSWDLAGGDGQGGVTLKNIAG